MKLKNVWYSNLTNVKSPDIIHQVLMFGTLDEIRSLRKKVGNKRMQELFINYPKKIYTKIALNFVKNFVLGINKSIDEQRYLKYTPRHIG